MIINPYLVIILLTLCLYFPALKCLVIVDDVRWYGSIKDASPDHWLWKKGPTWNNFIFWIANRLYSGGTFGIQWNQRITRWSITSVQIDHAFSIFLQCLICILMYADFHSLWAVLLWASASSTTQIAVWLNGRRYAINCILVLLMVACLNAGGWWSLLTLPLYALTPLFHMTAFCTPLLYWPSIPVMAIVVFMFWPRLHGHWQQKENAIVLCSRKDYTPNRLIIIIKSYGFYFFKMIFPMMTRTNYGFLYRWGVTPEGDKDAYGFNLDFIKGVIAIITSGVIFFFLPRSMWPLATFVVLATLQWCNIINATQIVADRYIILPNIFMQVIISMFLPWWVCTGIVVANICFTAMSYRMYENIQGMFDYHFYHWPQFAIVNGEYAQLCFKQGNYIKSYTILKECLRFNPTDWDLLAGAAICAKAANDRIQTRAYLDVMEQHLYYGQEDKQKLWMQNFRQSL